MKIKKLVDEVLKEAGTWDNRYLGLTVHAVRRFTKEEDAEDLIQWFLSKDSALHFNAANPHSKELFLRELLPQLLREVAGDVEDSEDKLSMSCAMVTFLRPEWDFPEGHVDFDIGKAKKIIRNALAGFDFIGRFEAVTYQNETCNKGGVRAPLVCYHCHAILWTTASYSKLGRLRTSLKYRFRGPRSTKTGPHFSRVEDVRSLAKEMGYISKVPALGKRTIDRGEATPLQSSRVISYRSYFHMFNDLRKHDMYTFWLSGGDGSKLLRDARAKLQRLKNRDSERKFVGRVRPGDPGFHRYCRDL